MPISYNDSEVNVFHPICECALNNALQLLRIDNEYCAIHHQYTGALEMDFVIQNRATGRYLCVIEVKRTPADIHSIRYQFQAMSYVQMSAAEIERPFYILTNLECAFEFRYEPARPRVFQQIIQPGLTTICDFENDNDQRIIQNLTDFFVTRIRRYLVDQYEYLITLEQFAERIESVRFIPRQWKSNLAIMLYEYIRGAFTYINRNELRDIRVFRNDIARICNEAARINFREIFSYNEISFDRNIAVDNPTLVNVYDFGNQNITGDSVAGILHQIVSSGHEHEGEVATDLELARFVAVLAQFISGNISADSYICDPAAGSGNLISSAIEVFRIKANQIKVNDWKPQLLELLSLRLGLNFVRTISRQNSPIISDQNVVNISREYFEQVEVILMNPPFVAGINCVERKQEFFERIYAITGTNALTNVGQMPLEAAFLELITRLVVPGTTIACIFPKTHLLARGVEARTIRRLLLSVFGLRIVFSYPGSELFDDVTKDTCVLIGTAMQPATAIDVISSYDNIPDIDIHRFVQSIITPFGNEFIPIMPGIVAKSVSCVDLSNDTDNGWRELNIEMVDAINFVRVHFAASPNFDKLSDIGWQIKRGTAGNSGGSDLIFFDTREDLYRQFENRELVLRAGMRNAVLDHIKMAGGDTKFLDPLSNDAHMINEIIEAYNALPVRVGRQQRQRKTVQEWINILRRESRNGFSPNSVLIPRGIRRIGKIYLSEEVVFVSTNFVVCTLPTYHDAVLLSTWMSTIFYQLICEVSSKDQEGMRKMEVSDICETYVPSFDAITVEDFALLEQEVETLEFLNLQIPVIRPVDIIWSNIVFGDDADEILIQAKNLLEILTNNRNSL